MSTFRKIIFCVPFIIFSITTAQNERIEEELDKIKEEFSELKIKNEDFENLSKRISDYESSLVDVKTKLEEKLDVSFKKTLEDKAKKRQIQIINIAEFAKSAGEAFSAIDAQLAQGEFLQEVSVLNNPTNNDLGFSLESIMNSLLKKHIYDNLDKKKANKVQNFINKILNNPLTDILKSSVPSINNVIGFISNLSFGNNKISIDDFENFLSDFKIYFQYYDDLSRNANDFNTSVEQIEIRAQALSKILEYYVTERTNTFYESNLSNVDLHILLNNQFSSENVKKRLDSIVTIQYKNNPKLIIKDNRLSYSPYLINQARYILDELEALSSEYIKAFNTYFDRISITINKSKSFEGADENRIKEKEEVLRKSLKEWKGKFIILIDLIEVESKFKKLLDEELL